jgi:hypothetical protein
MDSVSGKLKKKSSLQRSISQSWKPRVLDVIF